MAAATIKLQGRQWGKEARPCSHGAVAARCQKQPETIERTRRRTRSSRGDRHSNGTGSLSGGGIDKRRENHEEEGRYLRESRVQKNLIRRLEQWQEDQSWVGLRSGKICGHSILCIFSRLYADCIL